MSLYKTALTNLVKNISFVIHQFDKFFFKNAKLIEFSKDSDTAWLHLSLFSDKDGSNHKSSL